MASELETLKAEVVALQTEKEGLLTANEALSTKIEELEKQIDFLKAGGDVEEVKEIATIPEESFKVDKVEYVFTLPQFEHEKQIITAKSALQNKELLAELVKMEFGGIKRKGE